VKWVVQVVMTAGLKATRDLCKNGEEENAVSVLVGEGEKGEEK